MIRAITEIGVAVRELSPSMDLLTRRLGAVPGPVQRFEPYGMEFSMCRVGNVDFELMAPLDEEGVIARFLTRHGEGLHHIGFAVDDIVSTQHAMETEGLAFVDKLPRRHRFLVRDFSGQTLDDEVGFNFSRPASLLGLLLEFIQYPPGFAFTSSTLAQQGHP